MRLTRPRALSPTVPAAALADIALLLVFFFLLVTRYDPGYAEVALPRAPCPFEAPSGAVTIFVQRTATAVGDALSWRVEDAPGKGLDVPGPEALFNMASRIVDRDPERTFLLRIDATVRYAVVDDVLETLRRAGVRNVVFGARPESAGA